MTKFPLSSVHRPRSSTQSCKPKAEKEILRMLRKIMTRKIKINKNQKGVWVRVLNKQAIKVIVLKRQN